MLGMGDSSPIAEYEATGDIERVYHEIRKTLRVSGVNLNFRTWAGQKNTLPVLWDAIRPNCETYDFENAADQLRTAGAKAALSLGPLHAADRAGLGESQSCQLHAALKLYHYINPKLLLLTSAIRLALENTAPSSAGAGAVSMRLPPGVPPHMYPMEMEDESPEEKSQQEIFDDIQQTLSLKSVNSDYRTMALWPEYLAAAWAQLKPLAGMETYTALADQLRHQARALAADLPLPVPLSKDVLEAAGADFKNVAESAAAFEQLLPGLIINIALCLHDWTSDEELAQSPFPVHPPSHKAPPVAQRAEDNRMGSVRNSRRSVPRPALETTNWREFQALQRVVQIGQQFVSYVDEGASNREPVILLHGIPTWGFLWHSVLPALAASQRTLIPDLPGFGFSSRDDTFDRSIGRQAETIDAWMETLGIDRAAIVAHDIGGGVALRLATLFPKRVSRLCVLNTVCYDSWPIELMLQFGHPWAHRKISPKTAISGLRLALKAGFAKTPDDAVLDGFLAPYRTEVGKLSLVRNAAALNTNLTTEITSLLPRIDVPTTILWGEDDKFQAIKFGERLAGDIPRARFVRIADARHFVMIDQTSIVLDQLQQFLS